MVRLTSLELTGFKSFAERTRVSFPEGVTAVIGPNGCGKSNLSDAIGWVLGSQSPRNLRGQKMEDFIFGGTDRRKSSGFAEVTLTLSRENEGPLSVGGVEIEGQEFEVGRKLYRSGESIYLINQKRCRLMDIQNFLEDAGLGFAGYAMIAQGKIDSFLTAKPLDRRQLIEEAAQITGYKAKRRNAQLKLELAQQNLLRINDIVGEIERQLRSLKRQAGKTRRYRELKEEFRSVQRYRLKLDSDRFRRELESLELRLEKMGREGRELSSRLEEKERLHSGAARRRESLELRLGRLQERRSQLELELDRAENSIRYQQEQIQQSRETIQGFDSERRKLEDSIARFSEELERFEEQSREVESQREAAEKELSEVRERVSSRERELQEREGRLEALRSRMVSLSAEVASTRNLREQLVNRLERVDAEEKRLAGELERQNRELLETRSGCEKKRQDLETRRRLLEEFRDQAETQVQRVAELRRELQELEQEGQSASNQLVALNERLQSLQELEVSRSHYSSGVKQVLGQLKKSRAVETSGTLAESIDTEPRYERLVEEFLDEELEYILVDSLEEALKGVSEVRSMKSGKCTFLSLCSTNGFGKKLLHSREPLPGSDAGVHGRLADVVRMQPSVQEAFLRVLPQRADAIVVSDMDRAMDLAHDYPEETFITLGGESLTPRGLVSGSAAAGRKLGLLGLKRKRRELERKVERQKVALEEALERGEAKKTRLKEATEELDSLHRRIHDLDKEVLGLGHEVRQSEERLARCEEHGRTLANEKAQLEKEREEALARREELGNLLAEKESQRARAEEELTRVREAEVELRGAVEKGREEWNDVNAEKQLLQERSQSLKSTVARIRSQKEEGRVRLSVLEDRKVQMLSRVEEVTESVAALQEQSKRQAGERTALEERLSEAQSAFAACKEELGQLEAAVEKLRNEREELQEERSSVNIERARLETQLESLEEQCEEQLRMALSQAIEGVTLDEIDPSEIRNRHEKLQDRLDRFGPINMTALKEYQELEERHSFLSGQREDVERSIADTTRAIQEINRRSRTQFKEAFEIVNRNFQEIFKKLFGGGECGMELLDEEDVLECGIDIFAQPPGKKLQNVMLLSGGEKALTVFALLIGIFMYRPSRFCVLDEVDAPLDDANVRRFGKLISDLSHDTQFIIVTHNKRTMEMAHVLYGITMEEPGISKVVSAQFH